MRLYDPNDWSLVEEIVNIPDIIVPRRDFDQMKRLISRLIEDREYRCNIAERCRNYIYQKRGNPTRAVRKCEEIYIRVLENKMKQEVFPPKISETKQNSLQIIVQKLKQVFRNRNKQMIERGAKFPPKPLE